jgi:tetratricopeptide (TPR) repeat protein
VPNAHELLSAALNHHKAGEFSKAASLYREVLSSEPRHADALHLLGVLSSQLGNADLAVDLISKSIEINPRVTEYHNNLGNALKTLGRENEAEKSYGRAIDLNSRNADAYMNLGILLEEQRRLEEARSAYQRALRSAPSMLRAQLSLGNIAVAIGDFKIGVKHIKTAVRSSPNHAPAHYALGNAQLMLGQSALAKASYIRSIQLDPNSPDAFYNLGNVYLGERGYAAAIDSYRRSITLVEPQADVYSNLGIAYLESEQPNTAIESFLRAIELNPSHAEAHFNLGRVLAKQKEHRKAIEEFDKAIELRPDYAKAFHSLGSSRQSLGELEAASDAYRKALSFEPGYTDVLKNLASVLALRGSQQGIVYLEQFVEQEPDSVEAHCSLCAALLMHGDYVRGWREYEWRWQSDKFTSPRRGFVEPQWQGEQLEGKTILLHAEQGFGDTLQFVRYVPLVAQRGGRVVLEVQPGLQRLLQHLPGIAECISKDDPLPEFHCHCPLMSLPLVFGTTIETIPPSPPNLLRAAEREPSIHDASEGRLRVGLVWAGNPEHQNDALRSMSLTDFLPLAKVDAVCFVSLQKGPASAQTGDWLFHLPEPCSAVKDFADTAEIVASLDLVITVDTAMAHLAGAIGKSVWILNSHIPDWRWGLDSETTPWYPSARLFRRSSSGGWQELMEHVTSELVMFRDSRVSQPVVRTASTMGIRHLN